MPMEDECHEATKSITKHGAAELHEFPKWRQKFLKVMTVQFGAAESRQTSGEEFEAVERAESDVRGAKNGDQGESTGQASSCQPVS